MSTQVDIVIRQAKHLVSDSSFRQAVTEYIFNSVIKNCEDYDEFCELVDLSEFNPSELCDKHRPDYTNYGSFDYLMPKDIADWLNDSNEPHIVMDIFDVYFSSAFYNLTRNFLRGMALYQF